MINQRLREETKDSHNRVEEIGYGKAIMSRTLTLDNYKDLIAKQYVAHKLLEPQIHSNTELSNNHELQLSNREKISLIIKDLEDLGVNINDIDTNIENIKLDTTEAALGALYVIEGSTLGGDIIYKALQRNENLQNINSYNYYNCYGENTRVHWKTFSDFILTYADNKEKEDAIVKAAEDTFNLYERIFQLKYF